MEINQQITSQSARNDTQLTQRQINNINNRYNLPYKYVDQSMLKNQFISDSTGMLLDEDKIYNQKLSSISHRENFSYEFNKKNEYPSLVVSHTASNKMLRPKNNGQHVVHLIKVPNFESDPRMIENEYQRFKSLRNVHNLSSIKNELSSSKNYKRVNFDDLQIDAALNQTIINSNKHTESKLNDHTSPNYKLRHPKTNVFTNESKTKDRIYRADIEELERQYELSKSKEKKLTQRFESSPTITTQNVFENVKDILNVNKKTLYSANYEEKPLSSLVGFPENHEDKSKIDKKC